HFDVLRQCEMACRGLDHAPYRFRRKQAGRPATEKNADDFAPTDFPRLRLRLEISLERRYIAPLLELAMQRVGIEITVRTLPHTPRKMHVQRQRREWTHRHAGAIYQRLRSSRNLMNTVRASGSSPMSGNASRSRAMTAG